MADIIQTMDAAKRRKLTLSRLLRDASGTHLLALQGREGVVVTGYGRSSEQALWNAMKADHQLRKEARDDV